MFNSLLYFYQKFILSINLIFFILYNVQDLIFLIIFVLLFICNFFFGKLPLNSISVKDIDIIYINEKNRNEGFITNDPNFKNLKKIDKSYFINLDRSVKRLEYLKDQCKKNNIQIKE